MCVRSFWFIVQVLLLCLVFLSSIESGVLLNCLFFPPVLSGFVLCIVGALLLDTYKGHIFLVDWPLYQNKMSLFTSNNISYLTFFSDISIATSGFLWLLFAWYIFFHLFTFNLFCIFQAFLLYIKPIDDSFSFLIQSDNIGLLIGIFSLFTFNVSINMIGFRSTILLFDFYLTTCSVFSFFWLFFIIPCPPSINLVAIHFLTIICYPRDCNMHR